MKYILLILFTLVSCGQQGKAKLYRLDDVAIKKYVNQKSMPSDPNITIDKTLVNNSYPIEIALYKDGQFFYNLPNLGDGKGTWKNTNGTLELKAKRKLFDMYIEVQAADESAQTLTIQFSDRFGPTVLKMMNVNI